LAAPGTGAYNGKGDHDHRMRKMRHLVSAACGLWAACAVPGWAEQAVVVELYTSQGCSSCPPADEFMETLIGNPRIIPLSLHVDYWDYIGWQDSFANPRFTDRQKSYARAIGSRTIYTPQMIVGGTDRVEGYEPDQLAAFLDAHLSAGTPQVTLSLERKGDLIIIRADADPPLTEPVRVQLVRYKPQETVLIERGENAGREVTYHNIVTSWEPLVDWPGTAPLELSAPAPGSEPAVVILQEQGPAAILAAARLD
jgi:hypothetical protein